MFSGIQEILVLVIIILLILFVPRILSRHRPSTPKPPAATAAPIRFTGRRRLALVASILWPLLMAAYFRPWQLSQLNAYLLIGPGPVLLGWAAAWIYAGFKKRQN